MLKSSAVAAVAFLVAAANTLATTAQRPDIRHLFGPSLSQDAGIFLATEADYSDHVAQRWSSHDAPSYMATIIPVTLEDVQRTVKIATAHGIPFLVTGGGHGVPNGLGKLHDGLQIDLSRFNTVSFNRHSRNLTVGGSAKFSQLKAPLSESGDQFPVGTAYCVGMVGATLGAGVSANQGISGLLIDLLEEVELVTATGDVVTASRAQNADLFWGLTGAGANFGIVTSATYRVPPTVNNGNVTNANYLFSVAQARDVFAHLALLDDDMPPELALNIAIAFNAAQNATLLVLNANYFGPPAAASPYLAPLVGLNPLRSEVLDVAWPDVFATSYFGVEDTKACGRNQNVNMRSVAARRTDVDALASFVGELDDFARANGDQGLEAAMVVHRFANDKVLEVPDAATAYPHRGVTMHIQLECVYPHGHEKLDEAVDGFLEHARAKLTRGSGYGGEKAVYVNFAHGDEGPEACYGARNLGRLSRLKQKWDPQEVFSFYNPVPVVWGGEGVDEL